MPLPTALALCLAGAAAAPNAPAALPAVDVELVLAVDVSRSMDEGEFALQRAGYVEAIRSPEFIDAVRGGANGRIAVAYFEWAESVRRESFVSWQIIDSAESARAFADRLASRPFGGYSGTSISTALAYGAELLEGNGVDGARRVIDVSGDGPNNIGAPVTQARDAAVAQGIVVNGLPILIRPSATFPDLDRYYAQCVAGGPGSFVMPIRSVTEFSTAIRRKLVMEVSGATPPPSVEPAADAPVDCLKGERDRRFYADPYFPQLDR